MRTRFFTGGFLAGLLFLVVLLNTQGTIVRANANVEAWADPNPFYYQDYINVSAYSDGSPDDPGNWCYDWDGCYPGDSYSWVDIYGSDGSQSFDEQYSSDTVLGYLGDGVPGANLQPTTYWIDGHTYWDIWYCWDGACDLSSWSSDGYAQTSIVPACAVWPTNESSAFTGWAGNPATQAGYEQSLTPVPSNGSLSGASLIEY